VLRQNIMERRWGAVPDESEDMVGPKLPDSLKENLTAIGRRQTRLVGKNDSRITTRTLPSGGGG